MQPAAQRSNQTAPLAPRLLLLALGSPMLLLAACAGPLNTEPCVGVGMNTASTKDRFCPPTITESALRELPEEAAATVNQRSAPVYQAGSIVAPEQASPSILSLDRSNWGLTQMPVPNDLAAHQPRFSDSVYLDTTSRRARGEFPTAQSALDTATGAGGDQQIKEAFVGHAAAAADIVLFVPRAIVESRPYRPTRTGLAPYQRQPVVQTIVPAPLTVVDRPGAPAAPAQPAPSSPLPADPAPSTTTPPAERPPTTTPPAADRPASAEPSTARPATVRPGTRQPR